MKYRSVISLIASLALLLVPFTIAQASTASTVNYTYDGNGNLVSDGIHYYTYNDANRLTKVSLGSLNGRVIAQFVYDHQGQRVKKIEALKNSGSGTSWGCLIDTASTEDRALFIDSVFGNKAISYYPGKHFVSQRAGNYNGNSSYYFANGERVARKGPVSPITFFHSDHLGSTSVTTDESGHLTDRTRYYPYGEIREGGWERYTYTGKERDQSTGFYYFETRHYAPELRHFTRADTVDPDIYTPQSLNRYIYTLNNPIKYIDPEGKSVKEKWGKATRLTKRIATLPAKTGWEVYKKKHYERNNNNIIVSYKYAKENWGKRLSFFAKYHGTEQDVKAGRVEVFNSPDGRFEVVFLDGQLVTDPKFMGTYNYYNPLNFQAHAVFDVFPYKLLGNSPEEASGVANKIDKFLDANNDVDYDIHPGLSMHGEGLYGNPGGGGAW